MHVVGQHIALLDDVEPASTFLLDDPVLFCHSRHDFDDDVLLHHQPKWRPWHHFYLTSKCNTSHLQHHTFGFSSYLFPFLMCLNLENRIICSLMCPLCNFLSLSPTGAHLSLQLCEKCPLMMTFQTISFTSALNIIRQSEICLQQRLRFLGKLWLLAAVHIICCAV